MAVLSGVSLPALMAMFTLLANQNVVAVAEWIAMFELKCEKYHYSMRNSKPMALVVREFSHRNLHIERICGAIAYHTPQINPDLLRELTNWIKRAIFTEKR